MRILVEFDGAEAPCYAWSYVEAFREMGHEVTTCGEGHGFADRVDVKPDAPWCPDLILDIENGRNQKGELRFRAHESRWLRFHVGELGSIRTSNVKTAALLVDSHGHPDLHAEVAKYYDHVFFAVWARRDLFAGHPSAHWCPNATDLKWFGTPEQLAIEPTIDVGFFGSKRGLSRADDLVAICKVNGWTYDVRQVASNRNPNRWPATGEAMARCRVLFNRGQKHDGPNQRVMESMAMGRPLLTDRDERDGMRVLFETGLHYYGYESPKDLEMAMGALVDNEPMRKHFGAIQRAEVEAKHLVKHRAAQILEVIS